MSVYDVDGNQLNSVYDLDGAELAEAYDIDGTSIFRKGKATGYSIENVVSYSRPRTLEVASQLNNLSDDWQTFIFVTDPHNEANEMHSQAIALYLLGNTNASMIVLGGDYIEGIWNKTRYKNWTAEFRESENLPYIHALLGNHECFGTEASRPDALDTIYNDFLIDKADQLTGNLEQDYYYFDVPDHKTRYVFINTSDGTQGETFRDNAVIISEAQLAWIRQVAQLPDASWTMVVLGHVNMMIGTALLANKADLIAAIETCNGSVAGYFCGHQHLDAVTKISDGFYECTMICDRYSDTYSHDENRSAGTVTESAVSAVSINVSTKDVVVRRVGAGQDFSYSYTVE